MQANLFDWEELVQNELKHREQDTESFADFQGDWQMCEFSQCLTFNNVFDTWQVCETGKQKRFKLCRRDHNYGASEELVGEFDTVTDAQRAAFIALSA